MFTSECATEFCSQPIFIVPPGRGKHPVAQVRTPYEQEQRRRKLPGRGAEHGYVCISRTYAALRIARRIVYPFKNESNDGYDTVEWAAALPYSNGQVGMFGEWYVGATQWLAAISHPTTYGRNSAQRNHVPIITMDGFTRVVCGALECWFDQSWTSILAVETLQRSAINSIPALDWHEEIAGPIFLCCIWKIPQTWPHAILRLVGSSQQQCLLEAVVDRATLKMPLASLHVGVV